MNNRYKVIFEDGHTVDVYAGNTLDACINGNKWYPGVRVHHAELYVPFEFNYEAQRKKRDFDEEIERIPGLRTIYKKE